jgi:hypothetical protein
MHVCMAKKAGLWEFTEKVSKFYAVAL